ncbi:MAG: permease-like cell division protein FtsX [Desulfobacterales bacterium]
MLINALRRAMTDIRDNKFLHVVSIVTIALSVFIVSAFSLFFNNATDFLDAWQKGVRIVAYLADDLPAADRDEIRKNILYLQGVSAVEFISKADAYEDLRQKIGRQSSLLDGLEKNPLPDAFEITLADSFRNLEDIENLAATIAARPHVEDVEYAQKWLHRFNGIYNLFKITGLVLAGIFFYRHLPHYCQHHPADHVFPAGGNRGYPDYRRGRSIYQISAFYRRPGPGISRGHCRRGFALSGLYPHRAQFFQGYGFFFF